MMRFLDNLFGRRRDDSSVIARDRLLTVLVADRVKLTPDMLEKMRREIVEVISKYVDIEDPELIDVSLSRGERSDHLKADIPVRRSRT